MIDSKNEDAAGELARIAFAAGQAAQKRGNDPAIVRAMIDPSETIAIGIEKDGDDQHLVVGSDASDLGGPEVIASAGAGEALVISAEQAEKLGLAVINNAAGIGEHLDRQSGGPLKLMLAHATLPSQPSASKRALLVKRSVLKTALFVWNASVKKTKNYSKAILARRKTLIRKTEKYATKNPTAVTAAVASIAAAMAVTAATITTTIITMVAHMTPNNSPKTAVMNGGTAPR